MNLYTVNTSVIVEGMHQWADAPDACSDLREPHRHNFTINVEVGCLGSDRAVECFELKREIVRIITQRFGGVSYYQFGKRSCEEIAYLIAQELLKKEAILEARITCLEDSIQGGGGVWRRPVWRIARRIEFSAAHHNPLACDHCAIPHGHNWAAELIFECWQLDRHEMGVNFSDIKQALAPIVSSLDHSDLNQRFSNDGPFAEMTPSCERLARWLFRQTITSMSDVPGLGERFRLAAVRLTEQAGDWRTWVEYSE